MDSTSDSTILWKKWIELQTLIKEEKTLTEIVKKLQVDNVNALKKNYFELHKKKIKVLETHDFIQKISIDKNETFREYELSEDYEKLLLESSDPIEKLIIKFRNNFDLLIKLIDIIETSKVKKEEIDSFVEMITHNFYENNLIQNNEQEEIIILIFFLLEREVSKMSTPSITNFINENSFLGRILKTYTRKPEVKAYISFVLSDIIIKIDNLSEKSLELDPNKIIDYLSSKKKKKSTMGHFIPSGSKSLLDSIHTNHKAESNKNIINFSYNSTGNNSKSQLDPISFPDDEVDSKQKVLDNDRGEFELTQKDIFLMIESEKSLVLKNFYLRQLKRISNNPNIFTNFKLYESLNSDNLYSDLAFKCYKKNFKKVTELVDEIYDNFISKLSMIPYVIRCICRLIDILLKKKFPEINVFERNSFIAEFIFEKWISPSLAFPDYNTVLTSTVISESTRRSLFLVAKIIKKINRSNFFENTIEPNFTLFNHYIIKNISKILGFYDKIIEIKLPQEIERILKTGIKQYTKIDYFKENPTELINIQTVLITVEDILFIYQLISKHKEVFKNDNLIPKIIEKLSHQENLLNKLLNYNKRRFFLMTMTENNPNKKEILTPDVMKLTFNNDIGNEEFRLKRIKFCIRIVLKGVNLVDLNIFSQYDKTLDTNLFFDLLNNIIQLEEKTNKQFNNDKIPLNWYSLYLTLNLQSISKEYISDDYKKLFLEILKEEKKEIDFLNEKTNLIITRYGLNNRNLEKTIEKHSRDFYNVKQIEKWIKISHFIKTTSIEACLRKGQREIEDKEKKNITNKLFQSLSNLFGQLKKDDDNEVIVILVKKLDNCIHKRLHYLERLTEGKPEKRGSKGKAVDTNKIVSHANSIQEFIRLFSKFPEIQEDVMSGENKFKVSESIMSYMKIVREYVQTHPLFQKENEEKINEIVEDIENYINRRLYKKVYSKRPLDKDTEFYNKTMLLDWITPYDLEINKNYLYQKLWDIAVDCLRKMDSEKSPIEKVRCISNAWNILNNCVSFCSGKDANSGTEELLPIFIYVLIKLHPKRLISNIFFIETFIDSYRLSTSSYGYAISLLQLSVDFILNISHSKLKMNEAEFNKKMNDAKMNLNFIC